MSDIGILVFSEDEIAGFFFGVGFASGALIAGLGVWLICRSRWRKAELK
jgi:hypothetical protein